MRTFTIGDIHGGFKGLIQVLEKVEFDYENDKLIALGDVTDGWPEVAECIEELMKIKNLIYIKGNHDEWTERFLKWTLEHGVKMSSPNTLWFNQGGEATVDSYEKYPELVDKHIEFLRKTNLYYVDEKNRIFMHAGFNPRVDLDKQYFIDAGQEDKSENAAFYWDRSFWELTIESDSTPIFWDRYEEIYIGHTPTIRYDESGLPVNIGNVWNMDTGATYSGKLSIMNIDTKEITQSDELYKLYPDHPGRNGMLLAK